MASKKQLQSRWDKTKADEIKNALLGNVKLCSPFGKTESGNIDLRGIVIDENLRPIGLELDSIDFTLSSFEGLIFAESILKNCNFDKAKIQWGDYKSEFYNCTFKQAKMEGSGFGGRISLYNSCDFSKADISGASGSRANFYDCNFDRAKVNKTLFGNSKFTRCYFSGTLKGVFFGASGGGGFFECDLRDAVFVDCVFNNMIFENCLTSSSCIIFRNWPEILKKLRMDINAGKFFGIKRSILDMYEVWEDMLNARPEELIDLASLIKYVGKEDGEKMFEIFKGYI